MKSDTHARDQRTAARPSLAQTCFNSCRKLLAQLESTKARILADFRGSLREHEHLLELAVNEAEARAWQAGFPHLLFPVLAEENARAAATWHARQQDLLRHSPALGVAVTCQQEF
jgi:hypothetical protein